MCQVESRFDLAIKRVSLEDVMELVDTAQDGVDLGTLTVYKTATEDGLSVVVLNNMDSNQSALIKVSDR